MIDYVFRYDPSNQTSHPVPPDAKSARLALEQGNRTFSRWMEHCRTGAATGEAAQHIIACSASEMDLVQSYDEMPKQIPFAVVLGCSDARVPTEMIFGQGFNSLFVTRVAGNILGDVCLGSIDFAVQALSESVRVVVVLGHSGCGAVKGAVQAYLEPEKYWTKANTQSLRTILQRLFVSVRRSANALDEVWGAGASQMPGYQDALVEVAVGLNTAHTAYALREEVERFGKPGVEVLHGVYNIRNHQVSMPVDPKARPSDDNVNLAQAPKHPDDFPILARKMAEILRP
ncbi:hypothetical protein BH23PLA1_BH23PLA1_39440 [soil metagenome]